jgi:hypothetical protein
MARFFGAQGQITKYGIFLELETKYGIKLFKARLLHRKSKISEPDRFP